MPYQKNNKTDYKPLGLQDTMPFGREKGKKVGAICEESPDYIVWMVNNTSCKFEDEVVEYAEECNKN